MRACLFVLGVALAASAPAKVSEASNPQIDFTGHQRLVKQISAVRGERLLSLAEFKAMAGQGVTILDARSAWAYKAGHIEGAVNLPLTDFTQEDIDRLLGDPSKPVLIYCNNNFSNHRRPVALKSAPVAVNVQTMIALAGYGYRNVYELGVVVDFNDPAVGWVKG